MNPGEEESHGRKVDSRSASAVLSRATSMTYLKCNFPFYGSLFVNITAGAAVAGLCFLLATMIVPSKLGFNNDIDRPTESDKTVTGGGTIITKAIVNSTENIDQLPSTVNLSGPYPKGSTKKYDSLNKDKLDKQPTTNMTRLPPNAEKLHPVNLLYMMGQNPTFVVDAFKVGREDLGFQCTATVGANLFYGTGKNRKECRKSAAQKACTMLYGFTYN